MLKKYKAFTVILMTVILLLTNLPMSGGLQQAKAASITISNTSYTLEVGHYKTLYIYGTSKTVTWSSGNTAVAVVSSGGKVTAKSTGTTTIYASVAGLKLSCKLTVIKISNQTLALTIGKTAALMILGTTNTVTWTSSNKAVAAVSTGGTVTAKAAGTATIYASVSGKKLDCRVTVTAPITTNGLPVTVTPTPAPSPVPTQTPVQSLSSTKVVGYYAAWARYSGYTPDKLDAGKLTQINYAFANIGSDLKITLGYPDIDAANISQINALKKINPSLKTIISVGGWSWSGRFSDAALTDASRNTFADSCVAFIVKYGFDGVDIDWEYPVAGGLSTNINRPEDKTNFTLLMQTLRAKLDARGTIDGKKYILSFAGAAGNWYLNNLQVKEISQYVDYVNLMTYDIHGNWEPYTNLSAPLFNNTESTSGDIISADSTVKAWINAGFPKSKIIMGVPFYGYIYKSVTNNNNGLYQSYSGAASISYASIAANYLNAAGYQHYFHTTSLVPYLFNGSTFITYEDAKSMGYKAKYIKDNSLGGAMIWELSQDPDHVLLNSLYQGLN